MDVVNGGILVSGINLSASLHDNQVAIPLATMTRQRVTSCYYLTDSRYDTKETRAHSPELKHVPLTDTNQRNRIADYGRERQAQYNVGII